MVASTDLEKNIKKVPSRNFDEADLSLPFELCIPILFICLGVLFLLSFFAASFDEHPEIQVYSLFVDNFSVNSSKSELTGNWDIILSVENPYKNKIIRYEKFDVVVGYRREFISGAVIKPFAQRKGELNLVKAHIGVSSAPVSDYIAEGVEGDLNGNVVKFDVTIDTRVNIDVTAIDKGTPYDITGLCEDLKVAFDSNATFGTMLLSPFPCKMQTRKR